jgi:uncharacterized protein (DUF58 family)
LHHHSLTLLSNDSVRRTERLLRHPVCALACAAVIAALGFVFVSTKALPLLGGILATLAIGCAGPWIAVLSATAAIAWEQRRCRVGDRLTATITRRSILPWHRPQVVVRWADADDEAASSEDAGDRMAVVPGRRGRFPQSAPALESNQPFGVITARRPLAMPDSVVVWPERAQVCMPAGLAAAGGAGRDMSERITGQSGDLIGARDYRTGDSVRSIHWPHTARCDTLVVRERPGAASALVRLVIDHHLEGVVEGDAVAGRRLDALIGIAFAIFESWRPRGVMLELAWPGREPFIPRSPADVTAVLDDLACLEPLTDHEYVVAAHGHLRPVDLEILLTTTTTRRASLATRVGSMSPSRHQRLWIIVGSAEATHAPARWCRGSDVFLHVPLEPDPIAAVDSALASLNHDPDTKAANCEAGLPGSLAPT